ncbi:MAG TPA: alpha/beta fold hydrolase, partial [Methylomirabilota bacterium]|nr:alpha/beta fold hydrolase [Methylomirabilota bacterium]
VGALDEDGYFLTDPEVVATLGVTPQDVERARGRVAREIERRMRLYGTPPLARFLPDREVVFVDDGLATGLTMRAAVAYARRHGARRITIAVPCASAAAAERLRQEADRVVSLAVDEAFTAVGAYYREFEPVSDDEVVAMLDRAGEAAQPRTDALRVSFENARGLRLAGELLLPKAPGPHPVVVVAHGWAGSKGCPYDRAVADALVAAGVAAFLFDFSGHGDSEGAPAASTRAQQVDDLRAALDVLDDVDDVTAARLAVAAEGSGAAASLRLAADDRRIRALALCSPDAEGAETDVPRVTAPTLLVAGEHDEATRETCETLLPRLGGPGRLEVVPLARAARLIADWLATHVR